MPMSSEVRPPYISRTISSRPSRPSAPRKNLPPAPNQCGPIGTPSELTTSRFSPSTVICLERVRCVGAGVGDVLGPERRRQHEDDDQDEESEEAAARPGCGAVGAAPGARDRLAACPAEATVSAGGSGPRPLCFHPRGGYVRRVLLEVGAVMY